MRSERARPSQRRPRLKWLTYQRRASLLNSIWAIISWLSAAVRRHLTHHSQTHTRGQEVADWSFGAVTSFLHPSSARVPAASQSKCHPVGAFVWAHRSPRRSVSAPLPAVQPLSVCQMPEGKNRTLLFWRHQLVFIVSKKEKKKKKKQRLSNRSKPLTRTCLIGSGWFALLYWLKSGFYFQRPSPSPPPPPCLSRLSPHLPLYHWLVGCNLFVLLCCHFLRSDGFLQIWSPWPLLAPLANTFFFFLPVCQHVTNICFPSLCLGACLPGSLAQEWRTRIPCFLLIVST